jgi:hypothetical protein
MQNLNKNKVQTLVTHQGRTVIESKDNKMLKQEDSSLFLARKTFSVRNILDALFPHYGFLQIRGTKFICKWRKVLLDLITCSLLLSFLSAYSVHCFLFRNQGPQKPNHFTNNINNGNAHYQYSLLLTPCIASESKL